METFQSSRCSVRDPLSFYRETITPEYVSGLLAAAGVAPRAGIFTAVTVVWLMIAQRISSDGSLAEAVKSLRSKRESELLDLSRSSGRARTRRVSPRTGGYAQARKRIPLSVVEQVADRLNQSILALIRSKVKTRRDVFILDGSTLRVAHTRDNLAEYPQYLNQHGAAHYPLVRFCVATDAVTGVMLRPSFGPYNGPKAVSEIQLARPILAALPKDSVVIADRYFGCFRLAYNCISSNLKPLLRMKQVNAARVLGFTPKGIGEKHVLWTPSKQELERYPELSDCKLQGKFVWCPLERRGEKKEMLILFTTAELPVQEIVKLYGLRWNVETDLRDLKSTLKLNFIDAKSPEMIAKEIILGACAYNLIRHMIGMAASAAKVAARRFSFAETIRRINALAFAAMADMSREHLQRSLTIELTDFRGLLLPIRGSPRPSEPRKVWPKGEIRTFSATANRNQERKKMAKRAKPKTD